MIAQEIPAVEPQRNILPLPADVLLRHRARAIARIDSALAQMNKQYARLKRRRENLSWPVRKVLMRKNIAQIAVEDPYLSSVAVQQETRVRPVRIVRYDGLAKLLPVRPTVLTIERKRGKHVPPFMRGRVVEVRRAE